jgi:hypothetical protein
MAAERAADAARAEADVDFVTGVRSRPGWERGVQSGSSRFARTGDPSVVAPWTGPARGLAPSCAWHIGRRHSRPTADPPLDPMPGKVGVAPAVGEVPQLTNTWRLGPERRYPRDVSGDHLPPGGRRARGAAPPGRRMRTPG